MKNHRKSYTGLVCLAILIASTLAIAGCLGSTPVRQGETTAPPDTHGTTHAAGVTTRVTTVPASMKPVQPTSAPDPSRPFIAFDPIGDRNIGNLIVVSGTTNLPVKTWVSFSRSFENSGEMTMATRQVVSGTNGINRWRFALDTSGLRPGSYTLGVATRKKDVAGTVQFSLKGTFAGTDIPTYYSGTPGSAGAPTITVQPIGDRQQGDIFLITGTTSLARGTSLLCQIYPAYFEDPAKRPASSPGSPTSIAVDTIVVGGTGSPNHWSCALDTEGYEKTVYIANVSTVNEDFTRKKLYGTTQFTLR